MTSSRLLSQPRRPWAGWLALCLALVMALAPAVSHAWMWSQGAQTVGLDICTSAGPSALTNADSPDGQESALTLSHCPFCLHTTDRVAPPPHPVAYLFLDQGGQPQGPVWQAFFYVPHFYSRAAPRGPPAFLSY